jgi:uncharacterized protein
VIPVKLDMDCMEKGSSMNGLSMYTISVPVFVRQIENLSRILSMAETWAGERNIAAETILNYRLAPDMLAFSRQVQIVSDSSKGAAARLTGKDIPRYEDNERTFGELQKRLEKTRGFLNGFDRKEFDGAENRNIELKLGGETVNFDGLTYLLHFALPNFYFHYTTAYDILRHAGLGIGKRDFLGRA